MWLALVKRQVSFAGIAGSNQKSPECANRCLEASPTLPNVIGHDLEDGRTRVEIECLVMDGFCS